MKSKEAERDIIIKFDYGIDELPSAVDFKQKWISAISVHGNYVKTFITLSSYSVEKQIVAEWISIAGKDPIKNFNSLRTFCRDLLSRRKCEERIESNEKYGNGINKLVLPNISVSIEYE